MIFRNYLSQLAVGCREEDRLSGQVGHKDSCGFDALLANLCQKTEGDSREYGHYKAQLSFYRAVLQE